jgi:hypothetical protein
MRFVLLISILGAALQADPITVVETRSAFGITDLSFSYNVPDSPGLVTAFILGDAGCSFTVPSCSNVTEPATAAIDLTLNLYTSGPVRQGVAYLQLTLSQESGNVSEAVGPYSLGGCASELTCRLFGYVPFELGVPFTIDLNGIARGFPPLGGGNFIASAELWLYELPTQAGDPAGAPVQISLVPEPGSAGLSFTGLSALVFFATRRRRNLPSI